MPARLHHIIACLVVAGALSAGCGGDADDHPDVATSRIAFVSDRDGYRRIYVMNADGSDQHAVSDPSHGSDRWPTWSPAGARIAFTSDQDGQDDIYVIDADGGNRRNITNTPDSGESHPAWSPDGARIAFASDREPAGLYVIDADGGNPMHVSADATNADWSPDGLQFAYFSIDPRGRRLALYWMDADGDNARVVAHIDPGAASPAWSPDNRWIAATTANDTEPLARIHD
ncbi:hypothetical protein HOK31_29520, partial [Candidatus Poribacteria bacterium]|nr:hypothetical protein [Candidatus Poribacteria bacterium]